MMKRFDITVIINTHAEGRLLHHTLNSVSVAIKKAMNSGLKTELIIVADSADNQTKQYLSSITALQYDYKIVHVNHKDAGLSRNHGVNLAKGEYTCLVDGDDIMTDDWLVRAYRLLENSPAPVVAHPLYQVSFGTHQVLWKMISSTSRQYKKTGTIEFNPFCQMMMARTGVVKETPYRHTNSKDLWGFEDWLWNCDTLAKGIQHVVVPRTMYAYRRKEQGSRLSLWDSCLLPQSSYFTLKRNERLTLGSGALGGRGAKKPTGYHIKRVLLRGMTLSSILVFSILGLFKPLHHRVQAYIQSLRNETFHFFRPPRVVPKVNIDDVPSWLIESTNKLSVFDHRVFINKDSYQYINRYSPVPSYFSDIYWDLAKEIGQDCTHLFLLPWLKKGGADLEVINYADAILKINPSAKIVMIATNDSDSPWAKRLDKRVSFISAGDKLKIIPFSEQQKLLATLCVQLQPERVHLINSPLGYAMYKTYAKPLSEVTKLYAQVFCLDHTPDGQRVHYFIDQLQDKVDYLTRVFTDNQNVIDEMVEMQALPRDKFRCHYQPIELPKRTIHNKQLGYSHSKPLRVLWAGRLDAQKRPDILIKIAEAVDEQNLPVKIDVFGSQVLDKDDVIKRLKKCTAVNYMGPYDKGLYSLDTDSYDAFLISSEWEGLPNAVLEAIALDLIVISSNAGGLPEIITSKTGYPVKSYKAVSEYVAAFRKIISNPLDADKRKSNAYNLIKNQHSWERFVGTVIQEDYAGGAKVK